MVPFPGETGSDSALTAGLRKKAEASKVIRPGMNNPKNRANDFSIEEYTYLQEGEPLDRQVPYLPDLPDSADTSEYFTGAPSWYNIFKPKDVKVLATNNLTDTQKQNLMALTQQNARRIVESMSPMLSEKAKKSLPDDLVSMRYEKTPPSNLSQTYGYVSGDNSIRKLGFDFSSPLAREDRMENAFHTVTDGGNPTTAAHENRHFVGEDGANKSLFELSDIVSSKDISSVEARLGGLGGRSSENIKGELNNRLQELYNVLVDGRRTSSDKKLQDSFNAIGYREMELANFIKGESETAVDSGGSNKSKILALMKKYEKGETPTPEDFEKLINLTTFAKKLNPIVIEDIKKNYGKKTPNIGAMPAK